MRNNRENNYLTESKINYLLKEAVREAESTDKRYTHEEVFSELRLRIADKKENFR